MRKSKKILKGSAALLLATGLLWAGTTVSWAETNQNGYTLWLEVGDLNAESKTLEPFDYLGLNCTYITPGQNEFVFVGEKSTLPLGENIHYEVNTVMFDEANQAWTWCEVGGDSTFGILEYDKVYRMATPEYKEVDGAWVLDYENGIDMTQFTDKNFVEFCEYLDIPYSGDAPAWAIHISVRDLNAGGQEWNWYFKPDPNAATLNQEAKTNQSTASIGWQKEGDRWWYRREDGTYPHNEWLLDEGYWYRFDAEGYMLASQWYTDGFNNSYYLGANGQMLTNTTTPDGYYVDEGGVWIP